MYTGFSGDIKFIDVSLSDGSSIALCVKTAAASPLRAAMGLAREAHFYQNFSEVLREKNIACPKCYYAEGDIKTGEVTLLIESLQNAVPSGTFFGAHQPNNWGLKDKLAAMCKNNPTPEEITTEAFTLYAGMHAAYWKDTSLLKMEWLRGSQWQKNQGEESWMAGQCLKAEIPLPFENLLEGTDGLSPFS